MVVLFIIVVVNVRGTREDRLCLRSSALRCCYLPPAALLLHCGLRPFPHYSFIYSFIHSHCQSICFCICCTAGPGVKKTTRPLVSTCSKRRAQLRFVHNYELVQEAFSCASCIDEARRRWTMTYPPARTRRR